MHPQRDDAFLLVKSPKMRPFTKEVERRLKGLEFKEMRKRGSVFLADDDDDDDKKFLHTARQELQWVGGVKVRECLLILWNSLPLEHPACERKVGVASFFYLT